LLKFRRGNVVLRSQIEVTLLRLYWVGQSSYSGEQRRLRSHYCSHRIYIHRPPILGSTLACALRNCPSNLAAVTRH